MALFLWFKPRSKWNEEFGRGAQLFFYLADEGGNVLDVSRENLNIHEDSLLASGSRTDIGDWELHLKSTVMLGNSIMIKYSTLSCSYYIGNIFGVYGWLLVKSSLLPTSFYERV
jgi:hypothetical protein